jgi:hypothetical protein
MSAPSSSTDADLLFKAVHEISTEGLVVYRAILNRTSEVVDSNTATPIRPPARS